MGKFSILRIGIVNYYNSIMELFSRCIALIMIAVFSPLFFVISIFSILFQGFPIFFIQERIGQNFNPFNIYKFRTMKLEKGKKITVENDSRITKWGSLLRKIKLDELPQLFNILKGEMRFIGPRPEIKEYVDKESFSFLVDIKPGLSDYGSILFRNESKLLQNSKRKIPYIHILEIKIELANYYQKRKGFIEDLKLVLLTILAIGLPNLALNLIVNNILSDNQRKLFDNI